MKPGCCRASRATTAFSPSISSCETTPREERGTQVDGCRIQSIGRVLQLDAEAVANLALARLHDQELGKF